MSGKTEGPKPPTAAQERQEAEKRTNLAKRSELATALEKARPVLEQVAAKHLNPERMLKMVLLGATKQPLLLQCDVKTVIAAVIQAAEMGLEVGGGFGHAYLVPFWNTERGVYEAQLIVGYQGFIELTLRTGKVVDVRSIPVFEGEHFRYEEGLKPIIEHTPLPDVDRVYKNLVAVYAIATLANGTQKHEVMSRKGIEQHRNRSKSKDKGPWSSEMDAVEMARKTPVRKMAKYLPKTRELAAAIALDEADEGVELPAGVFESALAGSEETVVVNTKKGGKAGLAAAIGGAEPADVVGAAPETDEELDRRLLEEERLAEEARKSEEAK